MSVLVRVVFTVLLTSSLTTPAAERRIEGNRTLEGVPAIPGDLLSRVAQYSNIRSAIHLSWHPSGESLLVTTRLGDTNQLHLVSQPLGSRTQLTFYKEPVSSGRFSPIENTNSLLFTRDIGGDENYQIFALDLDSGKTKQMTPTGSRNGSMSWSNDGEYFAYMTNREDPRRFDVWVSKADDPDSARMLVKGLGFYWMPGAWSPDDSKLLVRQVVSAVDTRPYIVDVVSGAMSRLGPADQTAAYGSGEFSADGRDVYVTSDLGSEFTKLQKFNLATGHMTTVTSDIDWGISGISISRDGKRLAFATNEDGISRLYLLKTSNDSYRQVRDIPQGIVYGFQFAPDDDRLALTLSRATSPADVYVYRPRKRSLVRWTKSEVGGLNANNFVDAKLIHYPTYDQVDGAARMIPAFVYRPKRVDGRLPVMISIHGGPEGQVRPGFSTRVQSLVNERDIIVITPNVRGSAGYGKSYIGLDNGLNRELSVRDIGSLLDWIKLQPDMDSSRVGVIGGSYGGYMVLASLVHYSDRIRAGVEYFGISSFVTFLRNTSDYRRDHRRQEYGDERKPEIFEYLNRTAPINNIDKISTPLFVLQGANDPRVPASESEQIVREVRANGKDVWYLLFDDEGHGFRKKPNQDYSNAAVLMFIEKYLM
jgi:dipeptidyl aminopeptidase/acylaminoacyl peptidase|tara:strand:+ start:8614 stop:10557 length:1944 start_codon:yes stop_codon:yes gene_type:complete